MKPRKLHAFLALVLAVPAVQAQDRPAATGTPLVITAREPVEIMLLRVSATSRCQVDCVVRNAPYSAERVSERVQVLADGNRISRRRVETIYRDSEGRTRTERDWVDEKLVLIHDPVARMTYRLYPEDRTGLAMALGEPSGAQTPATALVPGPSGGHAVSPGAVRLAEQLSPVLANASSASDPAPVVKSLGLREMEGVQAEGKLTSTTVPAGKIGNALPLISTHEVWESRDLRLILYSKSKDVRYGESVTRVQHLRRDEPRASLFAPPAEYTVKEIPRPR